MSDSNRTPSGGPGGQTALVIVGAVLVIVGLVSLGDAAWSVFAPIWQPFRDIYSTMTEWAFPLAIVVGGILLIVLGSKGDIGITLPGKDKRLYRSTSDKMIAGVLGGLADYLSIDPTLVRIVYALVAVFTKFWTLVVLYIIAAVIVPQAPAGQTTAGQAPAPPRPTKGPGETPQ